MAGPGSSGPTVMLHTPASSLVIFSAPPACQSAVRVTSVAFGARTRKVTVRSGWTSGEAGGLFFAGWAGTAAVAARRHTRARVLMVAPPGGEGPREVGTAARMTLTAGGPCRALLCAVRTRPSNGRPRTHRIARIGPPLQHLS